MSFGEHIPHHGEEILLIRYPYWSVEEKTKAIDITKGKDEHFTLLRYLSVKDCLKEGHPVLLCLYSARVQLIYRRFHHSMLLFYLRSIVKYSLIGY